MFKKLAFISLVVLGLGLSSCGKRCVYCHKIKMYDDANVGEFDIISKQEACGSFEKRKFKKDKNSGSDAKGNFRTWWECDLYPEDDSPEF
jgi:hypothetical protein